MLALRPLPPMRAIARRLLLNLNLVNISSATSQLHELTRAPTCLGPLSSKDVEALRRRAPIPIPKVTRWLLSVSAKTLLHGFRRFFNFASYTFLSGLSGLGRHLALLAVWWRHDFNDIVVFRLWRSERLRFALHRCGLCQYQCKEILVEELVCEARRGTKVRLRSGDYRELEAVNPNGNPNNKHDH